ncbi:22387_t:CDS:2, partial [Racocetra persica]
SHKFRQLIGTLSQYELKQRHHISKLASLPLTEISCNSSDLTELRIKKRQQQTELTNDSISIKENLNNSDDNREESANKLFEDLFGRK